MGIFSWLFPEKIDTHGFPETINKFWLAGESVSKTFKRKVYMEYFNKNRDYVRHNVRDVVPFFKTKDGTAFYEIVDWNKYPGSDPAMWDDQREYDLKFHHWEPKV